MLVSLISLALAAGPVDAGHQAKLLGWSKDGRYVVWTHGFSDARVKHHYFRTVKGKQVEVKDPRALSADERKGLKEHHEEPIDEAPGEMEITERIELAVVYDVQHDEQQTFAMKYEEVAYDSGHALKDKYLGRGLDPAAFEQWKKDHALTGKPGRGGPNGAKADIQADSASDVGWKGETLSWSVENEVTVSFVTTANKISHRVNLGQEMAAMYLASYSASAWWDPTGRRAMFVLDQQDAHTMRGEEQFSVKLYFVAAGTAVEVLASKAVQPAVLEAVDAVEAAGYAVTARGEAQKARPTSVVYADDKHQTEAQKIAAVIPGGATVEKLTWKANGDVVVALGDTAK